MDRKTLLPATLPDGEIEHEVVKVLGYEDNVDNERFNKFTRLGYDKPTWEPEVFLKNCKLLIKEYFERNGKEDIRPRRVSKRTRKPSNLS